MGRKHGETVCCAGITFDGSWKRQFPIKYRRLEKAQQFQRWDVIEYDYQTSRSDHRIETQSVQYETLKIVDKVISPSERSRLLNAIILPSVDDAIQQSKSLCVIRPVDLKFTWYIKDDVQRTKENKEYQLAASQGSILDSEVKALESCPYRFRYSYYDSRHKRRTGHCEDWETIATFYKWRKLYGEEKALSEMKVTFEEKYPRKGVVFAMGTQLQHPKTWMIIGVLRADHETQKSFEF